MIDMKKAAVKAVDILCNIVIGAFGLIVLFALVCVFALASFVVPSDSMSPAIVPGDRILVEKLSTGARIFDIFSAAEGTKTEIRRMPGWRGFRQGDVLVFNFPYKGSWDTIAMDYSKYYVKRCAAVPGDELEIKDFQYYVNGKAWNAGQTPDEMRWVFPEDSTARTIHGYTALDSDTLDCWTIRDFGPLYIPRQGDRMVVDSTVCARYGKIMEWESGKKLTVGKGRFCLGDEPLERYTFCENYYFVAGDRTMNSRDSRYWGLLPETFIVGRAVMIWWSERDGRIRWNRIGKTGI